MIKNKLIFAKLIVINTKVYMEIKFHKKKHKLVLTSKYINELILKFSIDEINESIV